MNALLIQNDYAPCTFDTNDSINEVALVPAQYTAYARAATIVAYNCDTLTWGGTDVLFNSQNAQQYFNPDECCINPSWNSPINSGWQSMLHELGHFLGLGHSFDFAMMTNSGDDPFSGAQGSAIAAKLMPDDVTGGRSFYPENDGGEFRVFTSPQHGDTYYSSDELRNFGNGPTDNFPSEPTVPVCRGDAVPNFFINTANRGTASMSSTEVVWISQTPAHDGGPGSGIQIFAVGGNTIAAQSIKVRKIQTTIPCGTAPGLYWVHHTSLPLTTDWESNDNSAREKLTLQVLDCGC
jgi:hypothetical protein